LATLATNCDEDRGARPNVRCQPDCLGFDFDEDNRDCCVRSNAFCPTAEEDMKCCYAYDHPEDPEPCEDNGTVQPRMCK
jgi:hypothetical protein